MPARELTCVVSAEGATARVTGAAYPAARATARRRRSAATCASAASPPARAGRGTATTSSHSSGCATAPRWRPAPATASTCSTPGKELRCRVTAEDLTTVESPPAFPPRRPQPQRAAHLRRPARRRDADVRHRHLGRRLSAGIAWLRDGAPAGTTAQRVNAGSRRRRPVLLHASPLTACPRAARPCVPTAPAVRTGPAIDGDARLGRTVTLRHRHVGRHVPAHASSGCATASPPAPARSGTIGAADVGHALRCRVTAAGLTTVESRTAFIPAPRSLVAPAMSGDPVHGGTLTCGAGAWDGDYALTYRWLRDGATVATGPTLAIDAPAGTTFSCVVTAAGLTSADSPALTVTEPAAGNRSAPYITGAPQLGATLTCNPGTWAGASEFSVRVDARRHRPDPRRRAPTTSARRSRARSPRAGRRCPARPSRSRAPVGDHAARDQGLAAAGAHAHVRHRRVGRRLHARDRVAARRHEGRRRHHPRRRRRRHRPGADLPRDGRGHGRAFGSRSARPPRATWSRPRSPATRASAARSPAAPANGTTAYTITHRWLRNGAPVANVATFTPAPGDVGATLRCEAIARRRRRRLARADGDRSRGPRGAHDRRRAARQGRADVRPRRVGRRLRADVPVAARRGRRSRPARPTRPSPPTPAIRSCARPAPRA